MDGFSIGLGCFQSELIGGSINLAKVVHAGIAAACSAGFDEIWQGNNQNKPHEKAKGCLHYKPFRGERTIWSWFTHNIKVNTAF